MVVIERDGSVAVATPNPPEKLSALSFELKSELVPFLGEPNSDPSVRAIALTGARNEAFVACADIFGFGSPGLTSEGGGGDNRLKEYFRHRIDESPLKASVHMPLDQGLRCERTLFTLAMAPRARGKEYTHSWKKRRPIRKDH